MVLTYKRCPLLSPYLFNTFVDGLLRELYDGAASIPRCLFYADDGTLLASCASEIQRLLDIVASWSVRHRITLNVKKCGYIAPPESREPVYLGGDDVPRLEEYNYLGFPVGCAGIDFAKHLSRRLDQACGRAQFLPLHSDRSGPAHRLRIYRQYLAAMFEYGALVVSHAERCSGMWEVALNCMKKLTGWVAGYESNTYLTRNLLGLQSLSGQFASLKTSFQTITQYCQDHSPLKTLRSLEWKASTFFNSLTYETTFQDFLTSNHDIPVQRDKMKRVLRSFKCDRRDNTLFRDARRWKLTRLIPPSGQLKHGMRGADRIPQAPRLHQRSFLQYRRGTYNTCQKCVCDATPLFHRGHEACCQSEGTPWLAKKEQKAKPRSQVAPGSEVQLTDVDFLLNAGRFDRAYQFLQHIIKTHWLQRTRSNSQS